jgi:isoleucyl-tRNA synthetase
MVTAGLTAADTSKAHYPEKAEVNPLSFVPIPHNDDYELDFHLPYIDEVSLLSKEGEPLARIPEVVDCWVESGSMPFAEYHYPFENKDVFHSRSPGDFISEYIGQTRAWFYYLHAMSVAVFGHAAFKNVVTTGTVLATSGEKLSKSKANYTDPYELFDRYGADAFRYYLMSSVVMQAEDLTFRDDDVKEASNRVVSMFRNTLAFYKLFATNDVREGPSKSKNPLDLWILARLRELVDTSTNAFDTFDIIRGTRPIRDFIEDFSTWYVRRSRERVRQGGSEDAALALQTMRHVLHTLSLLVAPVMPFIAEEVYQVVKGKNDPESVHLAEWPTLKRRWNIFGTNDDTLLVHMQHVRALASQALQLRQKANIKVRQPLSKLTIPTRLPANLTRLLGEEVNVKEVVCGSEFALDTALSPELIVEGDEREMTRAVAEVRKTLGLSPKDKVKVTKKSGAPYQVELSTGIVHFDVTLDAA